MAIKAVRKNNKNPPVLSHEFIIQNHADIVSCVAMVFILGLMFQTTNPLASSFILLSYNVTQEANINTRDMQHIHYTNGLKDTAAVFFYSLICVVIHAVIQEYGIDKITKKLHLSKTKHSRFNESGQLLSFAAICAAWGINLIFYHNIFTDISSLWVGYPDEHVAMPFQLKMFFIIQFSYWIHTIPELYFQKVKKDDMLKKLVEPAIYVAFIFAAYAMNFTRVGLILLVLRFIDETLLQFCKLLNFAEKTQWSEIGFRVWNVLFVACRLVSFIVTILTFHYGLATLDQQGFDLSKGNFNSQFIRINSLAGVCLIQAWLMWNFIHFHLRRTRDREAQNKTNAAAESSKTKGKKQKKERSKRHHEDDVSMLPEVDQNSRRRK